MLKHSLIFCFVAMMVAPVAPLFADAAPGLQPAAGIAAAPAQPKPDRFARWEKEITAFEKADALNPPPAHAVEFVGSSSIRIWNLKKWFPDVVAFNRGFGGSHIIDCVHFAPRIVTNYKTRLIVFYAGDNDIDAGESAQGVLTDFKAFHQIVHASLPDTKIIFLSIKPSISRWRERATQVEANRLIEAYCKTDPRLLYVEVGDLLLDYEGKPLPALFQKDGLHMNPAGYALWSWRIRELLH